MLFLPLRESDFHSRSVLTYFYFCFVRSTAAINILSLSLFSLFQIYNFFVSSFSWFALFDLKRKTNIFEKVGSQAGNRNKEIFVETNFNAKRKEIFAHDEDDDDGDDELDTSLMILSASEYLVGGWVRERE